MASLVARTRHAIPESCSGAVADIWRSVGRSLSSSVLQHRSSSYKGLDAGVPPSPEAPLLGNLLDTPVSGQFPHAPPKPQTLGADRPAHEKIAYLPNKWEGFRVSDSIASLKSQLKRTALNEVESSASNVAAKESHYHSPTQGFLGSNQPPIGANIHVSNALALLKHRQEHGIVIDSYTFVDVLKRCSSQKDLVAIRQVHAYIVQGGMDKNQYVANTLLKSYVRCGRLQDARHLFDGLRKRDNFTWSIMIGGYVKNGQGEDALAIFSQMREAGAQCGAPLCLSILNACSTPSTRKWGEEIHTQIIDAGFESDVRIGTALVQMYAKCGSITEARTVFDTLPNRDIVTLSVMLVAYAEIGFIDEARELFNRAENRDIIVWNIIIAAYAKSGRGVEAYELFLRMKREGTQPDVVTYLSILNPSAASGGALEWVKAVHGDAVQSGFISYLRVCNALIHMYAKCGSVDDARLVFNEMEKPNLVSWNAMIGALAEHGWGIEALELLQKMDAASVKPDEKTFVAVLSACSHAGLVADGRRLFLAMSGEYGIKPSVVLIAGWWTFLAGLDTWRKRSC